MEPITSLESPRSLSVYMLKGDMPILVVFNDFLLLASNHCKISLVEDLIKRPECSREQRIDALELLGASLCLTGTMPEEEAAFQYIKRGMEERFQNTSDPILKQSLQPVKAYQNKMESQTLEELALIELSDTYAQELESLLIMERILGENNIELLEAIRSVTSSCDESRYELLVGLCRYAMKIAQCYNQTVGFDLDHLLYLYSAAFEESKNLPSQTDVLEVLDQAITALVKEKEKTTVESEKELTKLFGNILQLLQFLTKDELCGNNKNASVSCILQKLCALNPRDEEGNTLLHIAAASRNPVRYFEGLWSVPTLGFPCIKTVQLLLDAGFNVNALNNNGDTPLHRAAMFNPYYWTEYHRITKMPEVLLLGGAHLDCTDNDGLTAMDKSRNVRAESFLSYRYNMTLCLKCVSARAVKKYGLPYFGEVPKSLEKFISMH